MLTYLQFEFGGNTQGWIKDELSLGWGKQEGLRSQDIQGGRACGLEQQRNGQELQGHTVSKL